MRTIGKLISAWMLTLVGSLILPLVSVAAVSGTTYDARSTTTTTPATIAKHTASVETVRSDGKSLQSMADGRARSLLGMSGGFVAPKKGTIYEVDGSGTKSGKPYVGRHKKSNPAKTRRSRDGRDRTKAKVVDTYDPEDVMQGRIKEQRRIDKHGLQNLDNKRNEIRKR